MDNVEPREIPSGVFLVSLQLTTVSSNLPITYLCSKKNEENKGR